MLSNLKVKGLRGFGTEQSVDFAVPGGECTEGLTVIVGENNSGKSTLVEAIRAAAQMDAPSFSQGRRNLSAGDQVDITVTGDDGGSRRLRSLMASGSEATFTHQGPGVDQSRIFVLPSRRVFDHYFGKSTSGRSAYMQQMGFPPARSSRLNEFAYRLFKILEDRSGFDRILEEVVGHPVNWSIDQSDNGQYFLKIRNGSGAYHTSEGMGEGLVSLMYIVDALYDSNPGDTIVIDEPELSLHPDLQRRLFRKLREFSQDRQIIISTHSPYFVEIPSISNGMRLVRVSQSDTGSKVNELSIETARDVGRLVANSHNPHVVGINARETLFSSDGVLLLEGQEDIYYWPRVEDDLGVRVGGSSYGWGVGGADNMRTIAQMLWELGFRKVAGLVDGNRAAMVTDLSRDFPDFLFTAIPADDIRTKPAVRPREAVVGLLNEGNRTVRTEYREQSISVLEEIRDYFSKL